MSRAIAQGLQTPPPASSSFALLSTGALLGLFTYVVRRPDRADSWLTKVTSRIEQSGPMLLSLACALGSVFLLADGIRGLIAG